MEGLTDPSTNTIIYGLYNAQNELISLQSFLKIKSFYFPSHKAASDRHKS